MMEGWESVELGDICSVKGGKRLPKGHELLETETNHKYIRARDIKNGKINFDQPVFISENTFKIISRYIVNKGDLIITIVGANIGDVAFVTDEFDKANLTENAVKLITKDSKVNSLFLKYALVPDYMKYYFQTVASGAAQDKLGIYKIKKVKINLPPLKTQRKIASILSAYDDLIENNLKRIKLLEEQAQQTYEEWFVRFKFPGYENVEIDEVSGLPIGWRKTKLKEIADFQNGYAFYTKGYSETGYAIIDLGNVSEYGDLNITGKEKFISEELYNELPKFHLNKYDIVVAMTDVTSALRILAKSAIIDKDNTYALNQRVGMLRPNTELFDYAFLYALLSDPRFIGRMKAMSKGAVQFYFNTKDIVNYETFLPTKDIIDNFTKVYKPILELRMKLKEQNQHLKEARGILLPRLMSGMIDVDGLKVKEPMGRVVEDNSEYKKV